MQAQITTQRRCEPTQRTPAGEINCSTAPAASGTVVIKPAATSPRPIASTKAGRYVSPRPTIKLNETASPVEALKSARESTERSRAASTATGSSRRAAAHGRTGRTGLTTRVCIRKLDRSSGKCRRRAVDSGAQAAAVVCYSARNIRVRRPPRGSW